MVSIKKIFPVLFLIALFGIGGITHAADTKGVAEQMAVTKHWDPAHPGHVHECPICHRTYNQPGDSGPASPGYRRCPNCFPGEPLVTPGNYPPQPPYPPAPPAPPAPPQPPYPPAPSQPPYPPVPPYPPNYYITTAELIKMARNEPTWEREERTLIEYVVYVSDLTVDNLFKLWNRVSSYQKGEQLLFNAVSTHSFTSSELLTISKKSTTYSRGDEIITAGIPMMKDMSLETIFMLYQRAHSYAAGDKMLLAAMPRLTTRDLFKLKSRAFYKETAQAIDEEIRRRQMYGFRSLNQDRSSGDNLACVDSRAIIKKAIEALDAKPSVFPVEKTDLTSENLDYGKIENFIRMANENRLKESHDLYEIKRVIIEKLKVDALNGNRKAEELLKELHLE